MLGMESILDVRRRGLKPKQVFWFDGANAMAQWKADQSYRTGCLQKGYIGRETFEIATAGSEALCRMDLRPLIGVEILQIQTHTTTERARGLHSAAKKAGAKMVTTVNFADDKINFVAIDDFEQVFA